MKGHILDFSVQSNTGVISADDGTRYTFLGSEWKEARTPLRNMRVDFDLSTDQQAVAVYLALGQSNHNNVAQINDATNDEENYHLFDWFMKCVRNYANFSGRARRKEFWFYNLCVILLAIAASILDGLLETEFLFSGLLGLGLFIPGLAVSARRLHDVGRSGWWYLICFAPIIGIILLLIWWTKDGDANENPYGLPSK